MSGRYSSKGSKPTETNRTPASWPAALGKPGPVWRLTWWVAVMMVASGLRVFGITTAAYTLSFDNLATGPSIMPFALPKFDSSLGVLQSVDFTWNFSGTVAGTATGVSPSGSIDGVVTHWVFFEFKDVSDNLFIVEPTLSLTGNIASAQNGTLAFGPSFQSSVRAFSVYAGDVRFEAWKDGPGDVSGTLGVYFTNTTPGYNDSLTFFPGGDSGSYDGSLSVAYSYVPVPEPSGAAVAGLGLLLVFSRMLRNGDRGALPRAATRRGRGRPVVRVARGGA